MTSAQKSCRYSAACWITVAKGYSIWVKWVDQDWGFRFFIVDSRQNIIYKSEAYFYDFNAIKEGMALL